MTQYHWTSRTLREEELNALSKQSEQGGFQQTVGMRRLAKAEGMESELIGVVDENNKPVAGAMVVYTPSRFGTEGSIWLGPLYTSHDESVVEAMTHAIYDNAKAHHATSVTCWPNEIYQLHDSYGAPNGEPHAEIVKQYEHFGWQHAGFTTGYDSLMNRWDYVKNLDGITDEKQLLASYAKNTRRNVKIARNSAVEVKRIGRDQLGLFRDICELSCEKQGFKNRSIEYFEHLYDSFGDSAEFTVAFIDLKQNLKNWENKRDKFAHEVEKLKKSLETSKYPETVHKKIATAQSTYESALKRIKQAKEYIAQDGDYVPVAAALFLWHPRECVYLYSGSNEKYAKFYAPTAIQHEIMVECIDRGIPRYNFYGIDGVFDDPNDPGRGVLEFKQGFNGFVEELLGEFTLPTSHVKYAVKKLAKRLVNR